MSDHFRDAHAIETIDFLALRSFVSDGAVQPCWKNPSADDISALLASFFRFLNEKLLVDRMARKPVEGQLDCSRASFIFAFAVPGVRVQSFSVAGSLSDYFARRHALFPFSISFLFLLLFFLANRLMT